PMLSVARALLQRGHRVRVLADPVLREEVDASEAEFVAWRRAPHRTRTEERIGVVFRDWEARTPAEAAARVRDGLICGPAAAFAADCRDELLRRPADAVVADHMLPGTLIGAEAEGVRTVSLATSLLFVPEWGVPAMGLGLTPPKGPVQHARCAVLARVVRRMWRQGLPAFNAAREANGLAPFGDPVELIAHWDRVLVLSSRALEFPTFSPPPHVRLVGARLDDPSWAEPWSPPPGDAPLVLVALSSTFMEQAAVLERVAAALGTLPVRGVVTTGPAVDPAAIRAPENVQVVRSAPHGEVLRHAAAVVTHAGHGTAVKTLAAGVPMVALPLGRDQLDIAQRVARAGTGLRLDARATPERIAQALRAVLTDPRFTDAARAAAHAMAAERREDRAVAELEALVRSG
ncbi:MAG TPA: glycosyltransferase, partial [Solirubrobacteraceae bacterium]|nr:glycosyltransferase [Solirubrobacteraceae bacterium]